MSVTGSKGIGIPTVLLYECEGLQVSVENKCGDVFVGMLKETEDTMNVFMVNVKYTNKHGKESKLDQVYIRGNQIRFIVLPDILQHAPMFTRVQKYKQTKGRYIPQGSGTAKASRHDVGRGNFR